MRNMEGFNYKLLTGYAGSELDNFVELINDEYGIEVIDFKEAVGGTIELSLNGHFVSIVRLLIDCFPNDSDHCAWEIEQLVIENM